MPSPAPLSPSSPWPDDAASPPRHDEKLPRGKEGGEGGSKRGKKGGREGLSIFAKISTYIFELFVKLYNSAIQYFAIHCHTYITSEYNRLYVNLEYKGKEKK